MTEENVLHPPTLWAQGKFNVTLTFDLECEDPQIEIEKDSVHFQGKGALDNKKYEAKFKLYADIVPNEYKQNNTGRCVELMLLKAKYDDPFWPRLTSDKKKLHWLHVDFNKMESEDSEIDECFEASENEDEMYKAFADLQE